LYGKR